MAQLPHLRPDFRPDNIMAHGLMAQIISDIFTALFYTSLLYLFASCLSTPICCFRSPFSKPTEPASFVGTCPCPSVHVTRKDLPRKSVSRPHGKAHPAGVPSTAGAPPELVFKQHKVHSQLLWPQCVVFGIVLIFSPSLTFPSNSCFTAHYLSPILQPVCLWIKWPLNSLPPWILFRPKLILLKATPESLSLVTSTLTNALNSCCSADILTPLFLGMYHSSLFCHRMFMTAHCSSK